MNVVLLIVIGRSIQNDRIATIIIIITFFFARLPRGRAALVHSPPARLLGVMVILLLTPHLISLGLLQLNGFALS